MSKKKKTTPDWKAIIIQIGVEIVTGLLVAWISKHI